MIAVVQRSVLIVDDDRVFRELARQILAARGFVVVGAAGTVAAAVGAARELRPAGLLLDVNLPDGDGIALARVLSALPWRPRILLTSTDPEAASPEDVRAAGATSFVPKDQLPNVPLHFLLGPRRVPE
jgi:DNA-binding NarL/FixJ family response regulator